MKPILFNTEMVRGLLGGTKTVTRRVVKPHYRNGEAGFRIVTNAHTGQYVRIEIFDERGDETRWLSDPYRPGDILYVRETWQYAYDLDGNEQPIEGTGRYLYAADDLPDPFGFWVNPDGTHRDSMPWRPSIHMPRKAARIFLRATDVRVERLWNITDDDLMRDFGFCPDAIKAVGRDAIARPFWDNTINPAGRDIFGWDANPWVRVIEFKRIGKEEALANGN